MWSRGEKNKPEKVEPPVTPCPDCDGQRVRANVSSEMDLRRGGRYVSDIAGSVCLSCGRLFLYAVDIEEVRRRFAPPA
ncbi:hypothetical protein [Microbispora siamensis]|uniref:Uncharacterized protein n=1 Tax=Microbispora siamensis TaxID=564413 RepID=A0ABQ4GIC5_9ACTN|nr:hypothetical protein [Microbispora siamensis]GIH61170.1 hypothetical protein Msi02_19870 [Microbispora siamensis]